MADAQTQALADLSAAVDGIAAEVNAATGALSAALAKAAAIAPMQPDDSAAIEAQVARIKAATAALTAAVPAPVLTSPAAPSPVVAPAPVATPAS